MKDFSQAMNFKNKISSTKQVTNNVFFQNKFYSLQKKLAILLNIAV